MQTHLKGFGLENFRVFKDYTWFDFAPITILTGPNNSGKSSLIKALLLLSNNANDLLDLLNRLNFNDNSLKTLGPTSCYNDTGKDIIFNLPLNYANKFGIDPIKGFLICKLYVSFNKNNLFVKRFCFLNEFEEELLSISLVDSDEEKGEEIITNFDFNLYEKTFDKSYKNKISEFVKIFEFNSFEHEIHTILKTEGINTEDSFEIIKSLHLSEANKIFSHLNSVFYLPILRGLQKRVYTLHEDSIWYEIFTNVDQLFKEANDPNYIGVEGYDEYRITFGRKIFIEKWLNVFGISENLNFHHDEIANTIFPLIGNKHLSDMGLGINQIISLILFVSYKPLQNTILFEGDKLLRDPIVILEEPETNLHPNFQSKLADLFVDASKNFGIQFIIETHSEYLIRKLQYLTAKKILKPEDSIIYYFHEPNNVPVGEKQVKKIEILEDGSLSADFGTGFFDEADNIAISLFNLKKHDN